MKYIKEFINWDNVDDEEFDDFEYHELFLAFDSVLRNDINDSYQEALDELLFQLGDDYLKGLINDFKDKGIIVNDDGEEESISIIVSDFIWNSLTKIENLSIIKKFFMKAIREKTDIIVGFLPEELQEQFKHLI